MKNFHLLRKELFQPLILLDVIVDEFDGQCPANLYGSFSFLTSVEPGFRPPYDAVLVGIDTDSALDVEALDVEVEIGKRVDDALALYGEVKSFFLSSSLMLERNTPCMRAR